MSNIVVIGTQWGDEGKGKIIDLLSSHFDIIARFQGGHNAGHTVFHGEQRFILHLIPTGILHPDKICIIGNGVVIDPDAFFKEIDELKMLGINMDNRLYVSGRAHLIIPYHYMIEKASEKTKGSKKIGTTGRGIGPAYETKMHRSGIVIADLLHEPLLKEKLSQNLAEKNFLLEKYYGEPPLQLDKLLEWGLNMGARVKPYITDTSAYLNDAIKEKKSILFEGAQGTMLDIDHGTYPYVTASNCVASNACTGLGIGPLHIDGVLGIIKAYTTRVGKGPFPTELHSEEGELLQKIGNEFGATTGRSRRCGWFDVLVGRYAIRLNSIGSLALCKLDVLDQFSSIKICTGYKWKGKIFNDFPYDPEAIFNAEAVYEVHEGWMQSTHGITEYNDLPERAKDYIKRIEELLEVPISIISTGSERDMTVMRQGSPIEQWLNKKI
ncbi:MAG: adenylosuccinate synthase [bacterium]